MTTNDEQNQTEIETKKPKSGCATMLIILAVLAGVIVLFLILYISALADGFANS